MADTRKVMYLAFSMMPVFCSVLAYVLVPSTEGGFPIALPEGSFSVHWGLVVLALALTVGSVGLGFLTEAAAPGPERRTNVFDVRWLIRLVMAEAVAILGLMATFVTQRPGAWVPFTIFSVVAFIAARPR